MGPYRSLPLICGIDIAAVLVTYWHRIVISWRAGTQIASWKDCSDSPPCRLMVHNERTTYKSVRNGRHTDCSFVSPALAD